MSSLAGFGFQKPQCITVLRVYDHNHDHIMHAYQINPGTREHLTMIIKYIK